MAELVIAGREIHLWTVTLEADDDELSRCYSYLSAEEQQRAGRFRWPAPARAYVIRRLVLRSLLAAYLRITPQAVPLTEGSGGKPQLAGRISGLEFNLSHSQGLALYGFTKGCALGVDLERWRQMEDLNDLVRRYFHPGEQADFFALGQADRHTAFFTAWTRKEAYVKALGPGLAIPLESFRVSIRPDQPACLLQSSGQAGQTPSWTFQTPSMPPDVSAALAYGDEVRPSRQFALLSAQTVLTTPSLCLD